MQKVLLPLAVVAVAATAVATGAIGASASSDAGRLEPWGKNVTGAGARQAASPAAAAGSDRIVLFVRPGREQFVDVDGDGAVSIGDQIVFTERTFNRQGRRIGTNSISCTVHFNDAFQCAGTMLVFGRGTIETAGTLTPRQAFVAITGGSGEFADAGGEANVASFADREVLHVLHLAR